MVSEIAGVTSVTISLLERSATVIIQQESLVDAVREGIEDCGFEAQVVSVEALGAVDSLQVTQTTRTVSLRVDGMFCQYVSCCSLISVSANNGECIGNVQRRSWPLLTA
jgi:Cu+-exporting ATPase